MGWSDLTWAPGAPLVAIKLEQLVAPWMGTPYSDTACLPQGGVNCVRWIWAIGRQLQGQPYNRPPRTLPPDAAMHDPERARAAMRYLMTQFGARKAPDFIARPGDVLVTGPEGGGPGHALLVGTRPHTAWHVGARGVTTTHMGPTIEGPVFHALLRLKHLEQWQFPS